jgi:hypothetical protein
MLRQAQFPFENWEDEHQLLTRLEALRKARLIGPILAEHGTYYLCASESDMWGTKRRRTKEQLWDLVHAVEAQEAAVRKSVASEGGVLNAKGAVA